MPLFLAGAPVLGLSGPALSTAQQSTILAGVKACVGSTVDPAGQAERVRGWSPATPAQKSNIEAQGDILVRDNVLLVYKAGDKGGCVVLAQGNDSFDRASFFADVSKLAGVRISGRRRKLVLPNGELMAVEISGSAAQGRTMSPPNPSANYVIVAIANRASENAKHAKRTDG